MATIKEVAKEAGLSVASVSRYINNKGYVSDQAKLKIEAAIQKLDYRPNEIARSLFQNKTRMIALLLPDITNPFFPMLARGAEDFLVEKNYQMVLSNTSNDIARQEQYYRSFQQHNFAGIITAVETSEEQESAIPFIQVDRTTKESQFFVKSDHHLGGRMIGEYVCQTQPKKVLIMVGPQELMSVQQKNKALIHSLEQATIPYETLAVETFGLETINWIVATVLERVGEIDTVVATNDMHAMYILKAALQQGLDVPNDLQIMGYDGIDFAELSTPQLTTVKQNVYQMGYLAAETLIKKIENEPIETESITIPVEMVEGQTMRKVIV